MSCIKKLQNADRWGEINSKKKREINWGKSGETTLEAGKELYLPRVGTTVHKSVGWRTMALGFAWTAPPLGRTGEGGDKSMGGGGEKHAYEWCSPSRRRAGRMWRDGRHAQATGRAGSRRRRRRRRRRSRRVHLAFSLPSFVVTASYRWGLWWVLRACCNRTAGTA